MKEYCRVELEVTVEDSRLEDFLAQLRATMRELNAVPELEGDIRVTPAAALQEPSLKVSKCRVC
jgi:hypothetical protein